jgi:hypothetical protein
MPSGHGPGRPWKIFLALLYASAFALLGYLAWEGSSYYAATLVERPRHPDYWRLKPGGSRGIVYGIVGAGLMTVMLAYSLRKRLQILRGWGALRYWLDLHIFCGVLGPLFIVLHSSFKVHGLVALSFWSMVAVALSGVLGRYLYLQIPRAATGDRLTLEEVEAERIRLGEALLASESVGPETLEELSGMIDEARRRRRSLPALLVALPVDRNRLRRRLRRYAERLGGSDQVVSRDWIHRAWRRMELERRLSILSELQALFHYWHVIHKPFAVVMYLFMIVHIVVATMTGYVPLGP